MKPIYTRFVQFPQIGGTDNHQPPQTPQYNQQPVQSPEFEPPKNKRLALIIGIIIAAVLAILFIGMAIGLATRAWDPLWNPFRPKPEQVLGNMLSNMKGVKTVHSKIIFGVSGQNTSSKANFSFNANIENDTDRSPEDTKLNSKFSINIKGNNPAINVSADGEMKILNDSYFLKIDKLPGLDKMLDAYGIDVDPFLGKWVELKADAEKTGADKNQVIGNLISWLTDNKLYSVKAQMKDELIGSKSAYHYIIGIDKNNFADVITSIYSVSPDSASQLLPTEEIKSKIKKALDNAGEISLDVWIGKEDLLLYKMKFNKSLSVEGKTNISFGIDLSNYGKGVIISAPADAKNVMELLAPILESATAASLINATNARLEANMNQLKALAEDVYKAKTSYASVLCSDKNIKPICDDIKKLNGKGFIVKKTAKAYCAYAEGQTIQGALVYYCVDSTGKKITKEITDPSLTCNNKTFTCPSNK